MSEDCLFCGFAEKHLILKEYDYWLFVLEKNQNPLGWTLAILKRHVTHFKELTEEELLELQQIVKDAESAIGKLFNHDWFNVMQLGNFMPHLHCHLVPRYEKPREYAGRTFIDEHWGGILKSEWKEEPKKFLTKLADEIRAQL